MGIVAQRVSSSVPVVRNGYLHCSEDKNPIPLGTATFDHWFRQFHRCRVLIPDGSGRWVGAKRDKGLIVLQKRVNKRLFQTSCGRSYSLRIHPPDYLESRALDLSHKIAAAVGEDWGNRFAVPDQAETKPIGKSPSLFKGSDDARGHAEYSELLKQGELEYLILSCGQGYWFKPENFYDFFEGEYSLSDIKAAIGRQRAVGNIIRMRNGWYQVAAT